MSYIFSIPEWQTKTVEEIHSWLSSYTDTPSNSKFSWKTLADKFGNKQLEWKSALQFAIYKIDQQLKTATTQQAQNLIVQRTLIVDADSQLSSDSGVDFSNPQLIERLQTLKSVGLINNEDYQTLVNLGYSRVFNYKSVGLEEVPNVEQIQLDKQLSLKRHRKRKFIEIISAIPNYIEATFTGEETKASLLDHISIALGEI